MELLTHKKQNKKELQQLSHFVETHCDLSLVEVHGFLTAIISGPSVIMPSEWMDALEITDIDFKSDDEAHRVISGIMSFYNTIAQELKKGTYEPLITLSKLESLKTIEDVKQASAIWARGYMQGVGFDGDGWLNEEHEEITTLLTPIMALILKDEQLQEEFNFESMNKTPDDMRNISAELLPKIVNGIYHYWLDHREEVPEPLSQPHQPIKTGRNEPCLCGSGKKYKKCCLMQTVH